MKFANFVYFCITRGKALPPKFMMLFPAVLMNFPNSKVCLIGEWSTGKKIVVIVQLKKVPRMYAIYIHGKNERVATNLST